LICRIGWEHWEAFFKNRINPPSRDASSAILEKLVSGGDDIEAYVVAFHRLGWLAHSAAGKRGAYSFSGPESVHGRDHHAFRIFFSPWR
jgi:hypothetical protein